MGGAIVVVRGAAAMLAALVAVVVGLVVAVLVIGLAFVQTDFGRRTLANAIEGLLSGPGAETTIGEIGRGLPARLSVNDVAMRDEEGVWLTVDRARVNWTPWSLLRGRLHVNDISADGIDIARLPPARDDSEPPPDDEPFKLPSLPVDVRVDTIAIRDLTLGEKIAGEAMTLDITGQVSAPAESALLTNLQVKRTDQPGLLATLEAEYDPATDILRVDADVTEPEGGVIARLAGLDPYPPVALRLEGRGALSDWSGRLTATAGDAVGLDAAIGIARTETLGLSLSGTAEVAGLVDPPLRAVVENAVRFDVLVVESAEERYRIDRMRLQADAIEATASGVVDLRDQTLDLAASLASRDATRLNEALAPMAVGQIRLDAKASGALALPEATLNGSITDAHVPDVAFARSVNLQARIEPKAEGRGAARTLAWAADIEASGVEAVDEPLAGLTGDRLTAVARGNLNMDTMLLSVDEATLASGPSRLSADGWMNLDNGEMDATVDADIGDLSGLGDAVNRQLSGVLQMNAHAVGNVQTWVLRDGTVEGTVHNLSFADPAIDEVIGDRVTLSANYAVNADSGSLEATIQAGEALNAHLDGKLTDGLQRLMATWRVEAPRLDVIGEAFGVPIAGAFVASGTAEGDLANPSLVATARLADASVAAFAIANAELNVNAETVTRAPSGEVSLKAATEAGPVDVNARFATPEEGRFSVGSLSARIPGLSLSGNADVDLADTTAVGRLQGNLNAPRGVEFGGARIVGTGKLDVRLDQAAGQQTIAFELSAGSVAASTGGEAQFQAGSIAASGRVLDAFGTPDVEAQLAARDVGSGDALARSVTASLDGPLTDAVFRLAVSEFAEPPLAVNANGTLGLEDEAVRVVLRQLQGFIGEYPFALQRTASVVYRAPAIVIDDFGVDVAGGRLRVDGTIGGAQTAASIDAVLPAEVAGAAAGMDLRGMIEASARLREQGGLLTGAMEVQASEIVQMIGGVAAGSPVDANVTVSLSNGRASANGQVHGLGPTPLVLTGEMPFAVDAETLQPRARESTPIRAQVHWRGDLQGLTQLLPVSDQRVAGEAIIDFGVSGTLERPVASGQIIVRNGTYEHLTYGTLIRNLDLTAAVPNAQTVQISLTGTDGRAGRINAEGRANLGEHGPIVLDVEFGNMALVRRDDVRAAASGDLSYRGTATAGKLSGRVETNGVEVSLLGHMPPTVVTLDVIEVRDGQRIDATPPPETAPGSQEAADETPDETIALDLALRMPDRVFVRGRGLDSEWQGELDITGTTSDVRVVGAIQVIRGTFDLVGTEFNLENSAISFDGGREITPRLNIQATHEARDITATIRVTGTSTAPELSLTSTPSLPESEILAQVLFGRTSGELGPAELVEIAMALDTLAGGGGGVGAGTLGALRETFGLARLSVGTDEAGAPVLRAGRYVTDRVYVETVQGARAGSSKFRVEVELTDRLALEAETGDVSQNTGDSLGLRWQYDY